MHLLFALQTGIDETFTYSEATNSEDPTQWGGTMIEEIEST